MLCLNTARVQHHSDASTNRLGREVASESAPHHAVAAVGSAHLAPVDSKAVVGGLGDEGDLLAEVKVRRGLVVASLDFDQRDGIVLCSEAALVTQDGPVHV